MSTPHTELSFGEIKSLAGEFGLTISQCKRVRKVYRVITHTGEMFALKPTHLEENELQFIQQCLEHLSGVGFPVIPFILSKKGSLSIAAHSRRFLLMPWFAGREADFNRTGELMFGAKLLARLHRTGGFHTHSIPKERNLWGVWPQRFFRRYDQLIYFYRLASRYDKGFDRLFKKYFTGYLHQAENALAALSRSPYAELVIEERPLNYLCHHDFSDRNLLLSSQSCSLLDFDYCILDLRLHDIANLLLRILRHDDWQGHRARFVLQVYHRQFPLTQDHLRLLHTFLLWPQDYWQIGLQYYVERLKWPEARFLKTLHRVIEDNPARRAYLKRFPEENGIDRFTPCFTSPSDVL